MKPTIRAEIMKNPTRGWSKREFTQYPGFPETETSSGNRTLAQACFNVLDNARENNMEIISISINGSQVSTTEVKRHALKFCTGCLEYQAELIKSI